MYFRLCFIYCFGALLSKAPPACAQPEKVVALAGGHAVLPCSLKIPARDGVPTVEWSKEGLNSSIVFLYRDGCETFGMKNGDFEFRASLFMKEVKNGNVSLRISNLRLSDAGTYHCLILQRDKTRQNSRVELVVASVPDLKLAVVFEEKEVVAATCGASCRLPAPLITIRDDEGNDVVDIEPSQQLDARGCYATRQTFSMREGNRRVVCGVKQPQTDMSRTVEILLSASSKGSNIKTILCAVGVTSLVWLGIFLIWRKSHKNAEEKPNRKKSWDSTSVSIKSQSLLTEGTCELQENIIFMGDVYHHDKPTTVQSFFESSQDFPGSPKESQYPNSVTSYNVADRKLMKKSSKHSKNVHQKQISKSTHCRVSKRTQGHGEPSERMHRSGSELVAGGNQQRNAHSADNTLIDHDHGVSLAYHRHFSWPSFHSSNRYSPLADLPKK